MNAEQQKLHDFALGLVKEDKRDKAEKLLEEFFQKQDAGTLNRTWLMLKAPGAYSMLTPGASAMLQNLIHQLGR